MSRFYVTLPEGATAIPLCVNGETMTLQPNARTEVPERFMPALLSSDHVVDIEELPDAEPEVGELDPSTAGASGGETAGGGAGVGAGVATDSTQVEANGTEGTVEREGKAVTEAETDEPVDQAEEDAALPEGFLDRSVEEILPDLDGKPVGFLFAVKAAEVAGKTRVTLMRALDQVITVATAAPLPATDA